MLWNTTCYSLRKERLQQLTDGYIGISIKQQLGKVTITGKGVDDKQHWLPDNDGFHGRGLLMEKEFCDTLEYLDGDNTMKASYVLQDQ